MDDATVDNRGRPSRSVLFWVVILSGSYLIINVAVLIAEYLSEMSKLDRGFFTDTVSPYFYTNLLTTPISRIHSAWSGYPYNFDFGEARQRVRDAVVPVSVNIGIQTVLLTTVITLTLRPLRKSRRTEGPCPD
jgi:hypothetical protein